MPHFRIAFSRNTPMPSLRTVLAGLEGSASTKAVQTDATRVAAHLTSLALQSSRLRKRLLGEFHLVDFIVNGAGASTVQDIFESV